MKLILGIFLILASLAAGCARERGLTLESVKWDVAERYPNVQTVTVPELNGMMLAGEKVVLLDVREAEEYAVSHLKGAKRARTLAAAMPLLPREDTPIVVYCSVGFRSAELAEALMGQGRTNVFNLAGSIFEWANEGLPLYREDERVNEVHPFDEKWGRLLDEKYHPGHEGERR